MLDALWSRSVVSPHLEKVKSKGKSWSWRLPLNVVICMPLRLTGTDLRSRMRESKGRVIQLAKSKIMIIMAVGNQGIRFVDLRCRSTWTPADCETTDVAAHKIPHAHLSFFPIGN